VFIKLGTQWHWQRHCHWVGLKDCCLVLSRSELPAIYCSQWDVVKVIGFPGFRLTPICQKGSVSQCDMFITAPPEYKEPNHQFMCFLVIWASDTTLCIVTEHQARQWLYELKANYKTDYAADEGRIFYFWPRIALTAVLCNPTDLLAVNLIWFIQMFPYTEPLSLPCELGLLVNEVSSSFNYALG